MDDGQRHIADEDRPDQLGDTRAVSFVVELFIEGGDVLRVDVRIYDKYRRTRIRQRRLDILGIAIDQIACRVRVQIALDDERDQIDCSDLCLGTRRLEGDADGIEDEDGGDQQPRKRLLSAAYDDAIDEEHGCDNLEGTRLAVMIPYFSHSVKKELRENV